MARYKGDPRWITVKYGKDCESCGRPIKRGETAFFYPNGGSLYCDQGCGENAAADFQGAAMDEAFMIGQSW